MNKQIERRSYSKEFKLEAVRLVRQIDQPKAQIARELDIYYTLFIVGAARFVTLGIRIFQKQLA